MKDTPAQRISAVAILTAVTAVFTFAVRIPVAPTRGYLNLGDVAIYFTALTFGPFTALLAGGLGTALADIIGGYGQWAPISLVVHGLQGLVIGLIGRGVGTFRWVVAAAAGTGVMVAGYFLAGSLLVGPGAALLEVPGNVVQNLAGVLIGVPLSLAVRRAYPPVTRFRW